MSQSNNQSKKDGSLEKTENNNNTVTNNNNNTVTNNNNTTENNNNTAENNNNNTTENNNTNTENNNNNNNNTIIETTNNNNQSKEDLSQSIVKRIFHCEKVNTYWKNQKPNIPKEKFIDNIFPPMTESLLNKKIKIFGVDHINIHEVDWKKSSDIYPDISLTLFPKDSNLIINYSENKGVLFEKYTNFFHAVEILISFKNLIPQIFKSKEYNKDGYYELYIYSNGEYKILILDDFFPIVKGTLTARFSKPCKNEIWLMLLEKAYAKLNGGYSSLLTCDASQVLQAFTGFPIETLNFYDIDIEDLENAIRINKGTNKLFCVPKESSINIGLFQNKSYELIDIFDVKTKDNQNNEKNLKLVKLKNLVEYTKYKGEWSNSSNLWNEDVKRVINFQENEKNILYMSLENLYNYFEKINIVHIVFNCNTKLIKIFNNEEDTDVINTPKCFNLYMPSLAKVSFSLVIKNKQLNVETTEYEMDLTKYVRQYPCSFAICKYDPDKKQFFNFEGCFNSNQNCEMSRELDKGYYVIWTYLAYEQCKDPKPDEYYLKVSSEIYFKLRLQCSDYKYHLIKEMVYSGVMQYQGPHIKKNEIYTMNDNFYNYSGLGLKIICNPFKECYQKWIFKPEPENMFMLFPYSNIAQFEIEVKPNNYYLLLAMKIDHLKPCNLILKSHFKTLKYKKEFDHNENSNNNNNDNNDNSKKIHPFNFYEFCSKDVKDDELDFNYYDYLNDEGVSLFNKQFDSSKAVMEYLNKNYGEHMKKLSELENLTEFKEEDLNYIEKSFLTGTYVGQVSNNDNYRQGKGAFISKENGTCFIGYWNRDKKYNYGKIYDQQWNVICEGNYSDGGLNGQGIKILEDGTKYEGLFKNDRMDGMGVYTFKDGSKWEGVSVDGMKQGSGKFTDDKGNEKEVKYINDELENSNNNNNISESNNNNSVSQFNKNESINMTNNNNTNTNNDQSNTNNANVEEKK